MVPLAVSSISWIRAEGDYARIHAEGRSYLVYRTLNELEARLDPTQFLACTTPPSSGSIGLRRCGRPTAADTG